MEEWKPTMDTTPSDTSPDTQPESSEPQQPTPPPAPEQQPPYTAPQNTPPTYNPYGWTPPSYQPAPPPNKKNGGTLVAVIACICVAIIVALSVLLIMSDDGTLLDFADATGTGTTTNTRSDNIPQFNYSEEPTNGLSTTEIIEQNMDSTVMLTIYTTSTSGMTYGQEVASGSATGIVMSADGYIITNWHCVVNENTRQPYSRVDVTLANGKVYEKATLIGADEATDLAVIKVAATDLKPATFGNSDQLRLGDRVVAIGKAGGLNWSASSGIISGLARDVYEDTGYAIKCLQIDAAINPGNSGGPLLNAAGQVIGINSAKIVAEEYEGLGFSIPFNEAKVIIEELLNNGYVSGRVALGIEGYSYYNMGFLISAIGEDSPLKNTDVRVGDLIVGINDQSVTDYAQLRTALAKHKVNDTVTLSIWRSTRGEIKQFTVSVKLAESKG